MKNLGAPVIMLIALLGAACSGGSASGLLSGAKGINSNTGNATGAVSGGPVSNPPGVAVPPAKTPTAASIGPRAIKVNNGVAAAGEVCTVVVNNANPQSMYVSGSDWYGPTTCHGGVWGTQDGGTTWTTMSTGLTDTSVPALWLNQQTPTTLVAATSHNGLYLSTDGAQTWKLVWGSGGCFDLVQQGGLLLAACTPGVYQSPDNGLTWTLRLATTSPARSLGMSGNGTMYVGLDNGQVLMQANANAAAQASNPSAKNYTILHTAVDPANAQTAYVVTGGPAPPDNFIATTDGGQTWVPHTPTGVSAQANAVASDGSVFLGADYYLYHSTDGGTTWVRLATPSGNAAGAWWDDRRVVGSFAGIANNLAVGSDQGLFTSPDLGVTLVSRNGDRADTSLYSVAVSGSTIFPCMQDYGIMASFDLGQTWSSTLSATCTEPGEGGSSYANPYQPGQLYDFAGPGLLVSLDNLTTCNFATGLPPGSWSGTNQDIEFDPVTHTKMYAAVSPTTNNPAGVYISNDSGLTWAISNWNLTNPVALVISRMNPQMIYVGNLDGTLSISSDGGTTWTSAKVGSASTAGIQGLTAHPLKPKTLMVVVGDIAQNGGGPFVSQDGGLTFAMANAGIEPTCRPLQIAYDPMGTGRVIVAGGRCLYASTDDGTTWTNLRGTVSTDQFNGVTWAANIAYIPSSGSGLIKVSFP